MQLKFGVFATVLCLGLAYGGLAAATDVNFVGLSSSGTGVGLTIFPVGTDNDIPLTVTGKGGGAVQLGNTVQPANIKGQNVTVTAAAGSNIVLDATTTVDGTQQIVLKSSLSHCATLVASNPVNIGTAAGPGLYAGAGVPSCLTGMSNASLYFRTDGAAGTRVYIFDGANWIATL